MKNDIYAHNVQSNALQGYAACAAAPTTIMERTAAQLALDSIEQTRSSVHSLHERLGMICNNLGVSNPPLGDQKTHDRIGLESSAPSMMPTMTSQICSVIATTF